MAYQHPGNGGPPRGGGNGNGGGLGGGPGGPGGRKHRHDDEEQGKLFVGGLSWDTTQESLLGYFGRFGEVIDCVVMKNSETQRSRGFGFVTFSDPSNIDAVIASCPHTLDGRTIDPKACNPRSMQKPKKTVAQHFPKVFLGGLPSSITETDLRSYFTRYGEVVEVVIMYDQEKKKSRGFGFLSFADEAGCSRAVAEHFVNIQNKQVEIKRAEPRTHQGAGGDDGKDPGDQWGALASMGAPLMTPNGHPVMGAPPQMQQQPGPPTHYAPAPGWGSTAYPPQYAAPAPAAPPQWGAPPPHQPPPPQHHQQPPAQHWGHAGYASPPPPGQVAPPPAQPTQYPGAVYPPSAAPPPQQQPSYWGGPPGPAGHPPPGPPDMYHLQAGAQQQPPHKVEYSPYGAPHQPPPAGPPGPPNAVAYPAYSQYQPPQPVKPGQPPPPTAYTSSSYEYQAATSPIGYPGPADLSGSLGPQRGAVYGTQPSPYHPYRRT